MFVIKKDDVIIGLYFLSLLYFDVHIMYGISLNNLISGGMHAWLSGIEYHNRLSDYYGKAKKLKQLFQAYRNLIEAFHITKKVYQISVNNNI